MWPPILVPCLGVGGPCQPGEKNRYRSGEVERAVQYILRVVGGEFEWVGPGQQLCHQC